ncbi:MAG: DNA integrity scanning protein DisA nucleotide-binding domain protein [Nanoarchaeota archaeon]|nr:DNA integrity scanning protein DisA nucleotide-binding domain protein [Nanoarchaeota archaeon]MBU1051541.1 DNA integrity scanning protein DisA nucleotide-binding domain protein [Nanoarchaeota archaeon]MBU1988605.1 DNA integrity scanning protein DisA nucleotide-binding domain protein [Nanoarchaeota archaeon]
MTDDISKELQESLIQVGLKIAKRREGALFVVGDVKHTPLVEQSVNSFNVANNPKLLESLALMDGAVVIGKNGKMLSYGALILGRKRVFKNFGTRHSAALSASRNNNLSVLVSEEDRKLRIFKNGKLIIQIDPTAKGVEKSVSDAINVLESVGAGTIGALGTSLLVPSLGIYLVPGIVVFGSVYYFGRSLHRKFSKDQTTLSKWQKK